jgi:hypothetical protein
MTLMETAQLLGNFGEFAGAIAVVVTLIYLALQIRQNTTSVQAATELDLMAAWNELSYFRAQSPELSDIYHRGRSGFESLQDNEVSRFEHLCYSQFNIYQAIFHQHQRGILADVIWEEHDNNLGVALRSPGVRQWLDKTSMAYSQPFRTHVDDVIENG